MRVRLSDEGRMSMRQERMLGAAMLVAGLALVGASITHMGPEGVVQAQVTPQTPTQREEPGARPTTPAPEPARPQSKDNEGATTGVVAAQIRRSSARSPAGNRHSAATRACGEDGAANSAEVTQTPATALT